MKRIITFFILVFVFSQPLLSDNKITDMLGFSLNGFVKTDVIYDSRQTVTAREGHFLLYPSPESLDSDNEDINAQPNFNILSIQSRLRGKVTGPKVLGAKTQGVIEGAFFGSTNSNINTFRLRHAFVKMDWENTSLLFGQTWHPMFIAKSFPGVVSFNTGAPFQPFARNPQIRLDHKIGNIGLMLAAASQRDFASSGPNGGSSEYLRNAVAPDLNAGLSVNFGDHLAGVVGEYKILKPSLTDSEGNKSDMTVSSYAAMAYANLKFDKLNFKLEGVYGQNLTNMMMLGGYALTSKLDDPAVLEYKPSNILSVWGEIIYGKKVEVGLFGGYQQNLGIDGDVENIHTFYGRAADIDNLLRISPRVNFNYGKFRFSGELEVTQASYGTADPTDNYIPKDPESVTNVRALFAVWLFF